MIRTKAWEDGSVSIAICSDWHALQTLFIKACHQYHEVVNASQWTRKPLVNYKMDVMVAGTNEAAESQSMCLKNIWPSA